MIDQTPAITKPNWMCRLGMHQWRWIDTTLPMDQGRRECLDCGKQQIVSMDTH